MSISVSYNLRSDFKDLVNRLSHSSEDNLLRWYGS